MRTNGRNLIGAVLLATLAMTTWAQEPPPARPAEQEAASEEGDQEAGPPQAQDLKAREKILEEELAKTLSGNFPGTPLGEVLLFLGDLLRTPVLVDATADLEAPVSVRFEQAPMRQALEEIARAAGLELKAWRGFLVMGRRDQPLPTQIPRDKDAARKRLAAKLISMGCEETPVSDVVAVLQDVTGTPVHVPDDVAELPVTLTVEGVPLSDVIDALAAITGCGWRVNADGEPELFRLRAKKKGRR